MQTLWIANGGYSVKETPNSYRAFLAAANRPFDGLLFSARFTKDHYPICADKPYLEQKGTNYYIDQYTLADLKQLGFFNFPNESTIELTDYLVLAIRYQKQIFVKINRNTTFKEIDYLIEQLKAQEILYQTTLVSAKKEYLVYLRNQDLELELLWETNEYSDELFLDCCKYHFDLLMKVTGFMKKMIYITGLFHEYKLKVGCIGTDNANSLAKYASIPVDYIFTGGTE
ncbi:MAG: hypothetical protein PHG08_02105 [Bacilli bacterium]|jgi:glycerophosphoryl diester phosphodiesterase|nr:hypothetical protein [Bacilli bacterium]HHU23839.1 hypothetical protein [Acholeplasmataceae bacterium]